MNKNINRNAQGGFTLIELIVVIVILGVLAATALPKFSDMGGEARFASVKAAKGALATTASVAHGQFLLNPSANAASITMEGQAVAMANGYPTAAKELAIAAGLSADDYTITPAAGQVTTLTVSPNGVTTAANCVVTYTPASVAAGVVAPPSITVKGSGTGCN
jgi:MSHA pilin protein MshA